MDWCCCYNGGGNSACVRWWCWSVVANIRTCSLLAIALIFYLHQCWPLHSLSNLAGQQCSQPSSTSFELIQGLYCALNKDTGLSTMVWACAFITSLYLIFQQAYEGNHCLSGCNLKGSLVRKLDRAPHFVPWPCHMSLLGMPSDMLDENLSIVWCTELDQCTLWGEGPDQHLS